MNLLQVCAFSDRSIPIAREQTLSSLRNVGRVHSKRKGIYQHPWLPQVANISVSCNLVGRTDTLDFALPIIRSSFPPGTKYQAWGRKKYLSI